jgi:hypothetical protein
MQPFWERFWMLNVAFPGMVNFPSLAEIGGFIRGCNRQTLMGESLFYAIYLLLTSGISVLEIFQHKWPTSLGIIRRYFDAIRQHSEAFLTAQLQSLHLNPYATQFAIPTCAEAIISCCVT